MVLEERQNSLACFIMRFKLMISLFYLNAQITYLKVQYTRNKIELKNFNINSVNEDHDSIIKLAYVNFSFSRVITVHPIAPVNKQGDLFVRLGIKSIDSHVKTTEQLSDYLEKEYFDFYHDPNPSSDSKRGYHTELMKKFIKRANRQWGEYPESEEMISEKRQYLIDGFFTAAIPQ
ncbi:hypothetical protein [Vibrio harveyi]|uniref:hypothetical protein n=1 Tax=Vibrio harveyi TaxID=669 RepID=UPI00237DCD03|nr:hypothetical protein [Vibrio harveyi]